MFFKAIQALWRSRLNPPAVKPDAGSAGESEPAASHCLAEPEPATRPAAAQPIWKPSLPINAMFIEWLLGDSDPNGAQDGEQQVLLALYSLLASDLNEALVVPRMPAVIPQLLACLRQDRTAIHAISKLISKDAALLGKVINTVNSSLYNPADKITDLDSAILMLGEQGLRYVIAKVAFQPIITQQSGRYTRRAAAHIWDQSKQCALACRQLADHDHNNPAFLAYLTGLMNQLGLIIVFRLLDQQTGQTAFRYGASFHLAISAVAATLSYRIALSWELPEQVVSALQQQAGGTQLNSTPLGCALHNADLLSKLRVLYDHRRIARPDHRLRASMSSELSACFEALPQLALFELKSGA